ncbi:MAG: nicotinamide-nucleotide amidohydrolase family protein [Gammaproteobacteria bacterium]|nr:nicotinamide-nucleotide amidohydrolase family protein [Gammaproteobacteria bacterium]
MAVAESCTGGWIAKLITDFPGSSDYFDRGFVTYSNQSKQDMLDVSATTLATHGAVSAEVVCEMVTGVLAHSSADIAVAVSGIAGPGGGSEQKPVGTVYIAWGDGLDAPTSQCYLFSGDREAVRRQAVVAAIQGVTERISL